MSAPATFTVAHVMPGNHGAQRVVFREVPGTFVWSGEPLHEGERLVLTSDSKFKRAAA